MGLTRGKGRRLSLSDASDCLKRAFVQFFSGIRMQLFVRKCDTHVRQLWVTRGEGVDEGSGGVDKGK